MGPPGAPSQVLVGVVVMGDVVAMLLLAVEAAGVGVGGVTTPRGDVGLPTPHKRKATSPAGAPCTSISLHAQSACRRTPSSKCGRDQSATLRHPGQLNQQAVCRC